MGNVVVLEWLTTVGIGWYHQLVGKTHEDAIVLVLAQGALALLLTGLAGVSATLAALFGFIVLIGTIAMPQLILN